jgi:hypothetical protein
LSPPLSLPEEPELPELVEAPEDDVLPKPPEDDEPLPLPVPELPEEGPFNPTSPPPSSPDPLEPELPHAATRAMYKPHAAHEPRLFMLVSNFSVRAARVCATPVAILCRRRPVLLPCQLRQWVWG